jgi:hypothetical protein
VGEKVEELTAVTKGGRNRGRKGLRRRVGGEPSRCGGAPRTAAAFR